MPRQPPVKSAPRQRGCQRTCNASHGCSGAKACRNAGIVKDRGTLIQVKITARGFGNGLLWAPFFASAQAGCGQLPPAESGIV